MSEKAFERAQRAQLKRRARIVGDTEKEVRLLLARALEKIMAVLADAPSDYQLWSLPRLAEEIGRVGAELGDAAVVATARGIVEAWRAGGELVTEPLAEILDPRGAVRIAGIAPRLDDGVLMAMRHFMADRMKDVSLKAANAINGELGLVVIGAQSPWDAQQAIQRILKETSASRAATIVRTELQRVYAVAGQRSLAAAAEAGVPMDKVWRRSGKAHPRLSHAIADGQRVAWDKPFMIGGEPMMHPHDPKASARNTVNCGCVAVPKPRDFAATLPDHKPFTAEELARNPTLAAIATGKAAGEPTLRELLARRGGNVDFAPGDQHRLGIPPAGRAG